MLVLTAVSSIKTRWAGSSSPCSRIQRRRARATSARCRSAARRLFFEGDVMTLEEPPQRAPAGANSPSAQCCEQFLEGGIRLFFNKPQYQCPVLLQSGCAASARPWCRAACFAPVLPPLNRCAHRNPEKLGRFVPRYSGCNRFDHAFAQVSRIGFRHALTPSQENQFRQTRSSLTLCESFRFKITEKCCRQVRHHHDRGHRPDSGGRQYPEGLARPGGRSMRLLPVGPDHVCFGAPRQQPASHGC
jgi:hypothetical protein